MGQVTIDERILELGDQGPRLRGSRCQACGNHMFPVQNGSCMRCGSDQVDVVSLATTGTLWSWTIQAFPPKAPPYLGETDPASFEPYGVGYVELAGQLRVEARLTVADPDLLTIGMPMALTTTALTTNDGGDEVVTFAFAPVDDATTDEDSPQEADGNE